MTYLRATTGEGAALASNAVAHKYVATDEGAADASNVAARKYATTRVFVRGGIFASHRSACKCCVLARGGR